MDEMDIGGSTTVINQIIDRLRTPPAWVSSTASPARSTERRSCLSPVGYVFGGGEGSAPVRTTTARVRSRGNRWRWRRYGPRPPRRRPRGHRLRDRLVPIIDWTRIITTGLTAMGVYMALRTIKKR
jgi:hypothetical protein